MVDALTPDGIRSRRFDTSRRGYERAEVERFLSDIADRVADLERAIGQLESGGLALGIDDQEALARELHTIGGDVAQILEAARSAAEGIRQRAEADASAWTTEARTEHDRLMAEADEQSQAARSSAWKEGTALLASATAEAAAMMATATEETLFVRAEAEREALRLTGDARRDRDEILRAARAEAEVTLERSRVDSDAVLRAANQQAEQAQERARALEDRRSELLSELEAARASITEMEEEIESKRQEMEAPPDEPEDESARSHHGEDGGSVRIVSPSAVVPLRPVDAEELVAEVTALRSGVPEPDQEPESVPEDDEGVSAVVVPLAESVDEIADDSPDEPVEFPDEPGEAEPMPEAEIPELVADIEPADSGFDLDHGDVEAEQPTAVTEEATPEQPDEVSDGLDSLFAALRAEGSPEATESPEPPSAEASEAPEPDRTEGDPEVSEVPEAQQPRSPETADGFEPQSTHIVDSSDHGSESPLPHQNAALRSIKRALVELQNETLEHLRTDDGWTPSEDFTDRFRDDFASLAEALTGERDDAAGAAFGADLYDAVTSTIERSRSAGSGEREVAAAASKVFRVWRSDEAERRVFDASAIHA